MNTEIEKTQKSIIESKRSAWASIGEGVYTTELKLQAMAQNAIKLASDLPSCIDEVVNAESNLALLKKEQKSIETERKNITSRFDELCARLMESEKSLNPHIKTLSDAIIAVKKSHEEELKKKHNKNLELQMAKQTIIDRVNTLDFEFKTKINNQVSYALKWALENNITPENVSDYINKCSFKMSELDFKCDLHIPPLVFNAAEELDALKAEHFTIKPITYIEAYKSELVRKFADYEVQFHNKQQALELAAKEEADKKAALEAEKTNKEIASKLESAVQPEILTTTEVKALRKSFEIDMPETVESAIAIMAAFVANVDKCLPKLKVNKWFSFTPAQAGIALAKVKCDDNNFQPNGIFFKEVSKL